MHPVNSHDDISTLKNRQRKFNKTGVFHRQSRCSGN